MLYVIEAIGTTLYKIGYSAAAPERRLNDLQTGCPYDLRLIFVCEGERAEESAMHNYMERKNWRVRDETGEWFDIKKHNLFLMLMEVGLGKKDIRNQAVSILSNASEGSRKEAVILSQWLEKGYKWEKSNSFNTILGVCFEDLWHEYFMYTTKYSLKRLTAKEVSKHLHDLRIGYKIDDSGLYYFNMRKR